MPFSKLQDIVGVVCVHNLQDTPYCTCRLDIGLRLSNGRYNILTHLRPKRGIKLILGIISRRSH